MKRSSTQKGVRAAQRSLTPQQATTAFKNGLVTEMRETKHIRQQMQARDFNMDDVRNVARLGTVRRPGEPSVKHGTFVYCMEGHDVDGDRLNIIFVVGEGYVKLVTGVRP